MATAIKDRSGERDMSPAWEGRRRAAAKRRAEKAIAELVSQGYTVNPPEVGARVRH